MICFCNEQLEPTGWNYALKKTDLAIGRIQREFQTLSISF